MLEIEILEKRKEVLHYLQELQECGESCSTMPRLRDSHTVNYWERVLQELNEIILQHKGCSQSGTYIRYDGPNILVFPSYKITVDDLAKAELGCRSCRLRGGVRFLLGNYKDVIHDLDHAHLIMQDDHWTTLYERALVKCMLARYSEAFEDVCSVISVTSRNYPNFSDIQELKTCIQHILDQRTQSQLVQDGVLSLQAQPLRTVEM